MEGFDHFENALSRAMLGEDDWSSALDGMASLTGSLGAILLPISGRHAGVPISHAFQETAHRSYFEHDWHKRDERMRGLGHLKRNGVFVDADFASVEEMAKHPYWQDFLIPAGFPHFAGISVEAGDQDWWCLALQRSADQGPFSASELNTYAGWSKKLSHAARVSGIIFDARVRGASQILDGLRIPAVIVDRRGHVVAQNEAVSGLSDTLRIVGLKLAKPEEAQAVLDGLVRRSLETQRKVLGPAVFRDGTGRLMSMTSISLGSMQACPFGTGRFIVLIERLDRRDVLSPVILGPLLGLTRTEATIARLLGQGHTVETAADTLGVSRETVRGHLKHVFSKTGTSRQAELVALLLAIRVTDT